MAVNDELEGTRTESVRETAESNRQPQSGYLNMMLEF
jgi:hypothetical protein